MTYELYSHVYIILPTDPEDYNKFLDPVNSILDVCLFKVLCHINSISVI